MNKKVMNNERITAEGDLKPKNGLDEQVVNNQLSQLRHQLERNNSSTNNKLRVFSSSR